MFCQSSGGHGLLTTFTTWGQLVSTLALPQGAVLKDQTAWVFLA